MMKKMILILMLVLCLLLAACGSKEESTAPAEEPAAAEAVSTATPEEDAVEEDTAEEDTAEEDTAEEDTAEEQPSAAAAITIYPLPDTTMDNLSDAILSVSLEEGGAYVDDTGAMQMDVKIYTYDRYDMVDISMLKVGDTLATHAGDVEITALERTESGTICINGGLDAGGFDLVTNDNGIFFELGFSDVKNWYEVGEETIRVSVDFRCYDNADPDKGEVVYYPGDFLTDVVTNYYFTPHNTTIRVEAGQIVEMHRVYVP